MVDLGRNGRLVTVGAAGMSTWKDAPTGARIVLGADGLSMSAAAAAAGHPTTLILSGAVRERITAAAERVRRLTEGGAALYGITTGFGPLAGRNIDQSNALRLQRGLVYHLATGTGPKLSWRMARSLCVARLCCLAQGHSGVGGGVIDALLAVIASPLAPEVPSQGTVGASGDLTPMAHVALALMGEGAFITESGERLSGADGLATIGIQPLSPSARDGLALVNGTAAMTGIAVLNHARAERLLGWAEALSVGLGEVLAARAEAWDERLGAVRPHPGQLRCHHNLNRLANGGARLTRGHLGDLPRTPDSGEIAGPHFTSAPRRPDMGAGLPIPQDAYTLRCVPQIIGAARDMHDFHGTVVARELNATTDNPVFPAGADDATPLAIHGGNFMGQHVAFASDALSTAVIAVAGLAERQVARVTDERLNAGLPAFLTRGIVGLDSGLMGAQVTASALLAEMRCRSVPASTQSISTNGANQDVVSMGTIAARATAQHLDDAASILAILALAVAQGVDIRRAQDGGDGFAPATNRLVAALRQRSPPLVEDRPLSAEIAAIAAWLDDAPAEEVLERD
ncbi:MAG: aromatic amino acid ammonia-lyase [Pseudomonadota bacterium]